MDCMECKSSNPEGNRFCGQCGAEIGQSLEGTIRKRSFRDRQSIEMEITEAVTERLMKWAGWLGKIAAVITVLFGIFLGKGCLDVRAAVEAGNAEITTAVREGMKDITAVRQAMIGINEEVKQIQSDIGRYKKVNMEIAKLQKEFQQVQEQIVDLGARGLRAKRLETTGPGPGSLSFGEIGCPSSALPTGSKVAYCTQGSPPALFQLTSTGDLRPVSSLSPIGFQDISVSPKPSCSATNRGTLYIEKGTPGVSDKPFVCIKRSDNSYDWIQFGVTP